jgi:hypothetical protein
LLLSVCASSSLENGRITSTNIRSLIQARIHEWNLYSRCVKTYLKDETTEIQ